VGDDPGSAGPTASRVATAPDDWLTTAAAGKRLGVAPGVVTRWIRVGRLRGRREQDRWRVTRHRWMRSCSECPGRPGVAG